MAATVARDEELHELSTQGQHFLPLCYLLELSLLAQHPHKGSPGPAGTLRSLCRAV